MKNKKRFSAGFLALVLIFSFTGCDFINGLLNPSETKTEETPDYDIESSGQMREGKFALEGTAYQLPLLAETLLNGGWVVENIEDNIIVAASDDVFGKSYSGPIDRDQIPPIVQPSIILEKNGKKMHATVENLTSFENLPLEQCHIVQLNLYKNYDAAPVVDIVLPGAVTIDSDFDTIVDTFGPADYFSYSNTYDSLDYNYSENSGLFFSISVQKDSGTDIRSLTLLTARDENGFPIGIERQLPVDTIFTTPNYITNYIAPAVLGSNIESFTISIEGLLIQLPAPASVLMDAGWIVSPEGNYFPLKTLDYLTANQRVSILWENPEGQKLYTSVANYENNLQTLENSMVYSISYNYNADEMGVYTVPGYHFELPGGISENATFEEVAIATAGILIASDNYISYEESSDTKNISFSFLSGEYFGGDLPPEMDGLLSYMELGMALNGETLWG